QKWQCEELCEFPVLDAEKETYGRMSQETALRIITYWNGDSGGGAAQSTGFDLLHYLLLCCREIKLLANEPFHVASILSRPRFQGFAPRPHPQLALRIRTQ